MANRETTYVGVDIGTTKVACLVGLHQEGSAMPSIIGLGIAPIAGVKRGVIVDLEESVTAVTAALEEAERMSGVAIDKATISIDGAHIQSLNSRGVIAVSRADHEITREDLGRVESAAAAIQLENNREIVQIIPKYYTVDNQAHVADPVGMNGVRLEAETHIITASTPALKNLSSVIFRAGITINDQEIVPLASAKAVLTKRQKDLGVIVIDIGGETTGVASFEDGQVSFTTILPIGSNHITKDIVYGLTTNIDVAEKLKLKCAIARQPLMKDSSEIDLEQFGGSGTIKQSELDTIVSARLAEIFSMAAHELGKAGKGTNLGAGAVLTGGGAKMTGIAEFASKELNLPVGIGMPQGLTGIIDRVNDPFLACAVGLMLTDMEVPKNHNLLKDNLGKVSSKLKSIFKSFMP